MLILCLSCSSENRPKGQVIYRLNADPTTLDPAYIVDVTGGAIAAKLFNGLIRLDAELQIVPDIARKWEALDRGSTYVFHLRDDVLFSNGRAVSAEDFKYSFERLLSPKGRSPNTWVLEKMLGAKAYSQGNSDHITGVEVVDRYTLRIRLERPFAPFLQLLTMTAAYVVPREEVERLGSDFAVHPIGTGPFVLKEWRHNTELVLLGNPSCFSGKPHMGGIRYRIIPEDLTAVTEFELSNIDVIGVPAYEYSRFRSSDRWKGLLSSSRGINTYYLGFNCARPPFDNPELRKAVAAAVDRETILRTFYEGRGRLASGPVPDILRHWPTPALPVYDPVRAREIVLSVADRQPVINFYVNADQEVVDIAEIIQWYLRKAGIEVKIRQLEWSAYKAAINNGEADMFWLSWWADYPDPENFLFPLFHSSNHGAGGNRSRYTNTEVDRLIEAGQRSADDQERNQYYMKAEYIIAAESPWVFMWHKTDFTLRQSYLKNYRMYPIYSIDKGTEVSF
ncbi:MAG: ABC transporter substrate-binding protein [Thermodesulfovibrionales bacterium]